MAIKTSTDYKGIELKNSYIRALTSKVIVQIFVDKKARDDGKEALGQIQYDVEIDDKVYNDIKKHYDTYEDV